MNSNFKKYLLKQTESSSCQEYELIQSLWSGYGKISRYKLGSSSYETVVVKHIALSKIPTHPRGWNTDFGHQRKVKSYKVETNWYEQWSELFDDSCRIPKFIGSFSEGADIWIILEDLNHHFPLRKEHINLSEIKVCLEWLANFHATFLYKKPEGLWEIGTYWNLATRPEEFEKIEHAELKTKANLIDETLNECQYQTIIHGDAKLANFCFSEDGQKVSAVDFQYTGGGCGMKDVAYFLGSCLSNSELEEHTNNLINHYFSTLQIVVKQKQAQIDYQKLEQEWRKMYPYACADFTRFLLGWMPKHQKINSYSLKQVELVLEEV
jgi:hypothetical protein